MKELSMRMHEHLKNDVTTLATCLHITTIDGKAIGLTDHDNDIVHKGLKYSAQGGFEYSSVLQNIDFSSNSVIIEGEMNEDLRSGEYDNADAKIFMLNYMSPEDGEIETASGSICRISYTDQKFRIELHGKTRRLEQTIGSVYSKDCRSIFGDQKCKMDIEDYRYKAVITEVINPCNFIIRFDDKIERETLGWDNINKCFIGNFFSHGLVCFTSGCNVNKYIEVKHYRKNHIAIAMQMRNSVHLGDKIEADCWV